MFCSALQTSGCRAMFLFHFSFFFFFFSFFLSLFPHAILALVKFMQIFARAACSDAPHGYSGTGEQILIGSRTAGYFLLSLPWVTAEGALMAKSSSVSSCVGDLNLKCKQHLSFSFIGDLSPHPLPSLPAVFCG